MKLAVGADGAASLVANANPIPVSDAGGALTVDAAELTAIQAATEATQAAVEGTLTVSGTVELGATALAALETITVASVTAAIPAGTNNIGDVDIASIAAGDNNIGNVDIASIAAGDNNIGNVDIASALPAGNNNIGDVDVASIAAGTNAIGNVGLVPRTSGGLTIFRSIDLDESEEEIKATAGQLYFVHAINLANAVRYLKFYNATAANVTVGTTTPVLTFPIPTQGDTNGAGFVLAIPQGFAFSTAITAAATTGLADNDTGAPGANEVVVNIGYA